MTFGARGAGAQRIGRAVFWPCAVTVALAIAAGSSWALQHGYGDLHALTDAGRRAGTTALLHPRERWQIFAYLPAAAYAFRPLAALPPGTAFVVNAVLMLACAALAGLIAARVFALPTWPAVGIFVTWPPVVYGAAIVAQNAAAGLLLSTIAMTGIATRSPWLAALPIGALLYKPTYALPLVAVLVVRRAWAACALVGLCATLWYLLSVVASGNDWSWPSSWWNQIVRYAPGDLAFNGPLSISATATLVRLGTPAPVVLLAGAAAAALGAIAIARSAGAEAAAGAMLLGLAWSPHAWAYDAALALPLLVVLSAGIAPGARSFLWCALFALATGLFWSRRWGFDPLLLVTIGASGWWAFAGAFGQRSPNLHGPVEAPA